MAKVQRNLIYAIAAASAADDPDDPPNMFDLCPAFQIDGNLGGPAVIMEMLVQSTPEEITLLPALPSQWQEGSLRGVRVRGGGKVDIVWAEGKLKEFRLQSSQDGSYRLNYSGKTGKVTVGRNKTVVLNASLQPIVVR